MKLLTSAELCRAADISTDVLDRWCKEEVIVPAHGGDGSGSHRLFTVMQAVGVVLACRLRTQGAVPSYLAQAIDFIGSMSEEELLANFEHKDRRGKRCPLTHLLPVARRHMQLVANDYPGDEMMASRDVKASYEQVMARLTKKAK